jgi:hypothetical protein
MSLKVVVYVELSPPKKTRERWATTSSSLRSSPGRRQRKKGALDDFGLSLALV